MFLMLGFLFVVQWSLTCLDMTEEKMTTVMIDICNLSLLIESQF
jgi:hypothetical protein